MIVANISVNYATAGEEHDYDVFDKKDNILPGLLHHGLKAKPLYDSNDVVIYNIDNSPDDNSESMAYIYKLLDNQWWLCGKLDTSSCMLKVVDSDETILLIIKAGSSAGCEAYEFSIRSLEPLNGGGRAMLEYPKIGTFAYINSTSIDSQDFFICESCHLELHSGVDSEM